MRYLTLAAAAAFWGAPAAAEDDARRDMSAHEHGRGTLDIAVENGVIWMGLEVPGADIVGFEHKAETTADREAVDAALALLHQPLTVFTLPAGAGCTVAEAEAEFHGGGEEAHDDEHDHEDEHAHEEAHEDEHDNEHEHEEEYWYDEHDHDEHEHEDEYWHEDEHDHEDAHDGEEHGDEEVHGAFEAEYMLNCAAPEAIDRMAFPYFDLFAGAETLAVTIVSAQGQALLEIERAAPVLDVAGRF